MMLLLLCFAVPAALLMWKLCDTASVADEQMEAAFQEMMREREQAPISDKEDVHAG